MKQIAPSIQFETQNSLPQAWSLHVRPLETNDHSIGSDMPERAKYFEIIWFKKGAGMLTVDLNKTTITDNSICIIAPRQYRSLYCGNNTEGYYISLSEEFLHLTESRVDLSVLVEQYLCDLPVINVDDSIEDLIVRLYDEYKNDDQHRTEILKGLVNVLMIYLSRMVEQGPVATKDTMHENEGSIVRKFMQLLKKHFATKKLVADYADELCITSNYLNFLVKKQTGFPASHHIQQYIIREAKRQALHSGRRMKEVADALGFEDYAHFSKFFKNYSGINFSSFKKNILSNNLL